jgi:GR25 family glycosyltransferase involved in LPS biosynthesis
MFSFLVPILSLCLIATHGIAQLEDHFKPAPNKTNAHKMKGIDFIYMINLDARPEKFQNCLNKLLPYGIRPYRFSAVNGWELSLSDINDVALTYEPWMDGRMFGTSYLIENEGEPSHEKVHVSGKKYFCHCMSRGAIGIVLSHLSVLQDAYNSLYDTIWVMEDDVELIQDPNLLSSLIKKLDALTNRQWDILFTDKDTKNQKGEYVPCTGYALRPNFSPKNPERFAARSKLGPFTQVGARYGAYSMIVRRSGMKKILDFIKKHKVFLPYDMDFYLPNNIIMYAVQEDVVSTEPMALSDNGGPNYLQKLSPQHELQ